jgi:signal transduction histidine kinase
MTSPSNITAVYRNMDMMPTITMSRWQIIPIISNMRMQSLYEHVTDTILNAQRLQRLTQDILDVNKIESKSLDLDKELFNLNEMKLHTIADYNRIIKEHQDTANLKLEFTDPKEDIFIEADKSRINQLHGVKPAFFKSLYSLFAAYSLPGSSLA